MEEKKTTENGSFVRPPIVAVMGHVDHGKTSILDFIRKSRVAAREAGGITQKIGAYQIEFKGKKITFIDTPGHAAFAKMRSRGAAVADLVVLVVAANDGVMPQTMESYNFITEAKTKFIVAINKIDLPNINVDSVKDQLFQNGIPLEESGGDIVSVGVSAKTGQGIDDLLEMIQLIYEMEEDKVSPDDPLEAIVIESKKDNRGTCATVIVKKGSLSVGDQIQVEGTLIKVRGLVDDTGKPIKIALPGDPVEVLGFDDIPPVGLLITGDKGIDAQFTKAKDEILTIEEGKFRIVLRVDNSGSLEALNSLLPVGVAIVSSAVGDITDGDVLFAKNTQAQIWGFNVKASNEVLKLAETEKMKIKIFPIIYEFIENLEKEIKEANADSGENILGKAEIVAQFIIAGKRIAGCKVLEGKISKEDKNIILERHGKNMGKITVTSMQHQKDEILQATKDEEFGALIDSVLDFKVGDVLISIPETL